MKDKLQFPFKRKGGNYLELLEDLGKDTMLGVKTVRATTRNTAIYFDDDGYTIQDAKKLASAIQDTYSDVTATADFGRNPYGEEVPFVFVDKVNSFTRESKMKKLNITKEQFEKSRYFKNKYGKLEYVSESGKMFKTSKGKLLKFKESAGYSSDYREPNPKPKGWDPEVHGVAEKIMLKEIVKQLKAKRFKAVARDNARYMEIPFVWPTMLFNNPKVEERVNQIKNKFPGQLSFYGISTLHGSYGAITFQMNKQYVFDYVESGNFHKFKESTKKFGRKFNEGAYHDKHYLTIRDYDKLPDEEKANYVEPMFGIGMVVNLTDKFYKNTDMYGRMEPKTGWRIEKARYMKRSKIWDYYIVNDDSLGDGFWAEEDWICDEYDESTKKRFGRKSVKESVGDVSTDPAYICPYCGHNNSEFVDADDYPKEGYFDGATFNAQFWCNECETQYNVTFELKVKEVTPNEDYHNDDL